MRGTKQRVYFLVVVLALQVIRTHMLAAAFPHEITVENTRIKYNMEPAIAPVHQWPEYAVAVHVTDGAGIETNPHVFSPLDSVVLRDTNHCLVAERGDIIDVRDKLEPALVRCLVLVVGAVVHRSENTVDASYCMSTSAEHERWRQSRAVKR